MCSYEARSQLFFIYFWYHCEINGFKIMGLKALLKSRSGTMNEMNRMDGCVTMSCKKRKYCRDVFDFLVLGVWGLSWKMHPYRESRQPQYWNGFTSFTYINGWQNLLWWYKYIYGCYVYITSILWLGLMILKVLFNLKDAAILYDILPVTSWQTELYLKQKLLVSQVAFLCLRSVIQFLL